VWKSFLYSPGQGNEDGDFLTTKATNNTKMKYGLEGFAPSKLLNLFNREKYFPHGEKYSFL